MSEQWCVSRAECFGCCKEWTAVHPLSAGNLDCPECGSDDTARFETEGKETSMSGYKTYVQGDRVMFKIGVQSFAIDYDPEDEKEIRKEEALEWMRHLLDKALWNLSKGEQG